MTSFAVVTAAGASERFGAPKLLAEVSGVPLLERTLRSLLDGGVERVAVVLGPEAERVRDAIPAFADPRVAVSVNEAPERGMLSSIQTGLADASGDPILVLPGDMPFVRPATVRALLEAYAARGAILSPRFQGKRGHPVLVPERLREEILAAKAGETLHDVLRRHPSERIDLDVDDRGVVRDVDLPGDLASGPS